MTAKQENQLSMYYVVQNLCDTHAALWQNDKVFTRAYEEFLAKLPLIAQYRNTQNQNTGGLTQRKNNRREELIDQAYFVANRLQSYAAVVQNDELLAQINYSRSTFAKYRDTDLLGLCTGVLEQAQKYLSELADYSLNADTLSNLQAAIQAYQDEIGRPRVSQSGVKNATEALQKLFLETSALLTDRLDKDMEVFRLSQPDFYAQYFHARRIAQTARNQFSLIVNVIDAATQQPIPNVKVSFTDYNTLKKTSPKGSFQLQNLDSGTYEMTLEKLGYTTVTQSFNIIDGETTRVRVEMRGEG